MNYELIFEQKALADLELFKKHGEKLFLKKIKQFTEELGINPRFGTGKPERLKGYGEKEIWSRRISAKHRLVYEILEDKVLVLVISAYGHYED